MISALKAGDHVYVCMRVVKPLNGELGSVFCCVQNPISGLIRYIPVPQDAIVGAKIEDGEGGCLEARLPK